jgi:fused signal recognition particle receptor
MQQYGSVNADLLNLRAEPSTNGQILEQLPKGAGIQVLKDVDAEWLQVKVDKGSAQGFVMKKFLTLSETKPAPPSPTPAKVTSDDSYSRGLQKTRGSFFGRIRQALGGTSVDDDTWDDLEALLVQADVGVVTTELLMQRLKERYRREGMTQPEQVQKALKEELRALLKPPTPLNLSGRDLSVILIVGVNGSGKTTTIGKLANRLARNNRKVMIAAGDTFRAAAIEQIQLWGERVGVPVIAGQPGSDPGAVVFDAVKAANARGNDILIVDTAGRLQNKSNLMEELRKIKGVMSKVVPDAPHEVLIVLDGTTGQNALSQAKGFSDVVQLTGVIVTKLDGTAKGGMLFAIQQEMGLPIHYVGLGEGIDDLIFFNPDAFVDSLFEEA